MTVGHSRAGFDVDLKFGESRETAFVAALTDCHVECKSDQKCRVTGNVAIEVRQGSTMLGQGAESGLSISTSAYWAIEYEDDAWIVIRKSMLKAKVDAAIRADRGVTDPRKRRVRMVGDGNRFECVLVPIDWLIRGWRPVAA